jgi:NAD(P)-dependent dehydrogenase (short-subunit alcohol dehydrogenase family)
MAKAPVPDLRGKRCVITGAASGIGRATALAAADRGAALILTDVNAEGLEETTSMAANVVYHEALDLTDYEAVVALGERAHRDGGSVDVVMNIAGISTWGSIQNLEHRHWQRTIDVDLMGPIHVLETFVPPMIEAKRGGHISNVSSAAGLFGLPWHAAYSAAKFGLRGVSEVLRFDLARYRIGVSLVCPGAVRTPLVGSVEIVGVDRESNTRMQRMTERFESRAVTPERVAERIIDGIVRNRYMVYTSNDIRFGHWVQRKFEWPYRRAMRIANDQLVAIAKRG